MGQNQSYSNWDPTQSVGYNEETMKGERLEKFKSLALQAQQAFPPPFVDKPQDPSTPLDTPLGNEALKRGRWATARRKPAPRDSGSRMAVAKGYPTLEEIELELGGLDGFMTLFGCHYMGMFENPRMNVLFDTRHADTRVNAFEHGKRVACTIIDLTHRTALYRKLGRGFSGAFSVDKTHATAKRCPMRPVTQQKSLPEGSMRGSRRFTTDQRDSWIGHIMCAAEQVGASKAFEEKLGLYLATTVSAYAPFVDEKTGKLDWQEETPYK